MHVMGPFFDRVPFEKIGGLTVRGTVRRESAQVSCILRGGAFSFEGEGYPYTR